MKKIKTEKLVDNAVDILSEFVPANTGLYFPLISSALVWLINRHEDWKKSIYSWQVWPDPDFLKNKPDEFVLDFFIQKDSLKEYFRAQIEARDMDFLRNAFSYLYPIFGLKDPFLSALFEEEIKSKDFKKIIIEFEEKLDQAKQTIIPLKRNKTFAQSMGKVIKEIGALCAGILSQEEIQEIVAEIVKQKIQKQGE
ncbi:MAG: hypothetical protein J7L72_12725 [Candidatus Aminicenantes bacterium]|nr:hypothetical protein [Candidatus Aminicenantes bacterium]